MANKRDHRDEPLVFIATFHSEFEASLARGALESVGISAFVPNEALGTFTRHRGGILPVSAGLQVFESDRERALTELRRMQIRIVEPASD